MASPQPAWAQFAHRYPIDGLRAIAALVVVLFHAGMPGFGNGFVGVDVFFVLSGFLITSLLLRERLTEGRISLRGFYARRVRRLLPAALLVLAVTAIAYQAVAPPLAILENRLGFVFAGLYVSNWYFLGQSQDYFVAEAAPSPVLHYWSLSVEEQFYLVWPALLVVLLAVAFVRRRGAPTVIGALAVVALVGSWLLEEAGPAAGYFNTFARAYQLLAGATLAAGLLWWRRRRDAAGEPAPAAPRIGSALGIAGVIVVVVAATVLLPLSPWWIGLLGVAGTLAVLAGVELAPHARALSPLAARPAQALGRWSYSMYLWHWPVIVIAGTIGLLPMLWWLRVPAVLVVTIVLAAVTYHALERPVNAIGVVSGRRQTGMLTAAVVGTAAVVVLSVVVLRVPPQAEQLVAVAQAGQEEQGDDAEATAVVSNDAPDMSSSATGMSGGGARADRWTVLVVGDSHANFFRQGFRSYAEAQGFRVVILSSTGCPWMDIPALSAQTGEDHECQRKLWEPALAAARQYQPDVTLLISRSVLSRELQTPQGVISALDPGWEAIVRDGTARSLAQIASLSGEVVLLEPFPQTRTPMLDCLTEGTPAGQCAQPAISTLGSEVVESMYLRLSDRYPNVVAASLDDVMCPGGTCPAMVSGVPTFSDDNHLTRDYAQQIMPKVEAALRAVGVSLSGP